MNNYLRAIGFSKIKSLKQLDLLYKEVMRSPDHRTVSGYSLSRSAVQLDKAYGTGGIGISMIGEMDSDGSFLYEHAFPYVTPGPYVFSDEVIVEERGKTSAYSGVIDNISLSVIFYIQNIAYICGRLWHKSLPGTLHASLAGLSTGGMVLLPLKKTPQEQEYDREKLAREYRNICRVRAGNETALDDMLQHESDIKDSLDRRVRMEDILSIVDNGMIPYGTESDVFDVIGTITAVNEVENSRSKEHVYLLDVNCLYYVIRIAINRDDLAGEPMPGRRFRGVTWLQGAVRE